ncbi:MAG: DUF1624 domain-containing protein [Planctomycetia bacterium]|nr:DUF1624 domain-containing protein [Planctomycetia bacterium]
MNRYLSIDVLRGVIMIIMALDHVIGAIAVHPAPEISLPGSFYFKGYTSDAQQWSRLLTHLCAPGFQLLAGMGLAISVVRATKAGTSQGKITLDLLIRGVVLILADFIIMYPIFKVTIFFMVLACIGSCTLCFLVLRWLPRDLIGIVGLAIIFLAPVYGPTAFTQLTGERYLLDIWTKVGFGKGSLGIFYPILPWLGIFAVGWWMGLKLFEQPAEASVTRSARMFTYTGLACVILGMVLRMSGWTYAEALPLNGADNMQPAFWQFTKYPPSIVFMTLTVGILLMLLGLFRWLLDGPDKTIPLWANVVAVYGRTAFFYFIAHFYLIGVIALFLGQEGVTNPDLKLSFGMAYFIWIVVLFIMFPLCYFYDRLRQRYRKVLRYF